MYRVAVTISSCVLLFALACDKGGGADKSAEAKPEDQKQPTAKQDEPAAKPEDSAAKPEPVAPDPAHGIGGVIHEQAPEAAPAPVADPAPAADPAAAADELAPHFDTSKDRGSLLAHFASSLVHDDNLAAANSAMKSLISLAGGDDKTPSDKQLCAHVWDQVFVKEFGEAADAAIKTEFMTACALEIEKERLKLGPEVFAEAAKCIMAAQDLAAIEVCDKAEEQAEAELHEQPHGDGVDRATCEAAVNHIFKLVLADMGDDEELIALIEADLEKLKNDVMTTCMDESTKAELECTMKAKSLADLEVCDK